MISAYGTTIFCDDIRQELGGKHIFIGIYDDALISHIPFPIVMPSFSFAVKILEPVTEIGSKMELKIFGPSESSEAQDTIFEVEAPIERWNEADPLNKDFEAQYITSSFLIKLSPFRINSDGFLRVRAYRNGDELKLGSLCVRLENI